MDVFGWVRIVLWAVAASVVASLSGVGPAQASSEGSSPWPSTAAPVTPGTWERLHTSPVAGTCGVATDGSGWCWGLQYPGDGSVGWSSVPTRVPGTWLDLRPGSTTCGIQTDRSAWCWGSNDDGTVGNGEHGSASVPTPYRLPGEWRSIEARVLRTCGIRTDDTLWCWGSNYFGVLGVGSDDTWFREPQQVPGRWRSVALKPFATCAVRTDDTGWCWGANGAGLVGDGSFEDRSSPTRLPGRWRTIAGRGYYGVYCGVRTDDTGWCWGENRVGNVGDGTSGNLRPEPRQVPGRWRSIRSNGVTCGIRRNGTGWCWGPNARGGVGTGSTTPLVVAAPVRLRGQWAAIEPGDESSCGLRPDGRAFCWGGNFYGDTGTGTPRGMHVLTPTRVRPHRFASISLSQETACGVRVDGTGWCWGKGRQDSGPGVIGDGFRFHRPWPQRVL